MRNDESNDDKMIAYLIDAQGEVILMHELIWESTGRPVPPGYMVSHKNGNGLDNRRKNLCLISDLNGDRDRLRRAAREPQRRQQ